MICIRPPLVGIYAAVAPAYNCLIRTSPYDPLALDIIPELADTWDISDGGKTHHLSSAQRREVARWHALFVGRCEVHH